LTLECTQIDVDYSKDYQGQYDRNGYTFTLSDRAGNFVHENYVDRSLSALRNLGLNPSREGGAGIHLDKNDSRNLLQLGQQQTSYAQPAPAAYPASAATRTQPQVTQPPYYQQQPSSASFYPAQQQPVQQNLPPRIGTTFSSNIMDILLYHGYKGLVSVEIGADKGRPGECVIFIKFQSSDFADRLANQIGDQQGSKVPRTDNNSTLIVGSERAKNMLFGREFNLPANSTYENMKREFWATSQNALHQSPAPGR